MNIVLYSFTSGHIGRDSPKLIPTVFFSLHYFCFSLHYYNIENSAQLIYPRSCLTSYMYYTNTKTNYIRPTHILKSIFTHSHTHSPSYTVVVALAYFFPLAFISFACFYIFCCVRDIRTDKFTARTYTNIAQTYLYICVRVLCAFENCVCMWWYTKHCIILYTTIATHKSTKPVRILEQLEKWKISNNQPASLFVYKHSVSWEPVPHTDRQPILSPSNNNINTTTKT